MSHIELAKNIFDCQHCHTRCDSKSKLNYHFESDVAFAEREEQLIIDFINQYPKLTARKSDFEGGFPDIEIYNPAGNLIQYLEIKAQRRTFMTIKKRLPYANLQPSETVALNLSDLIRYFDIEKNTNIPVSILWVLSNRPCMTKSTERLYFYQKATVLKKIYEQYQNKRLFRRKSGKGDIVNGVHKGVVLNYHFSINELKEWMPKYKK